MKRCSTCGGEKLLTVSGPAAINAGGSRWVCVGCNRRRAKEWRLADPERAKASAHRNYEKHKTRHAAQSKQWREANPERAKASYRASHLRRNYDMTGVEVDAMWQAQSGVCPICLRALPSVYSRYAIDHDHVTKKVRALLHISCNTGLGTVEKWQENGRLERSLSFLERHRYDPETKVV